MKFSGKYALLVFYTLRIFSLFSSNTFILNAIYSLHENRRNLTKLATPRIVYYGESHMKYTAFYKESKLPCSLQRGVTVTSGESIMKI